MLLFLKGNSDVNNLIAVELMWRIRFKHLSSLKAFHSRTWDCPTTGKFPTHCFFHQATIQDLLGALVLYGEPNCPEPPASSGEEVLNTWHCSHGWTWTLKHKTYKTLKTQYICNLGPSCSNLNFFSSATFRIIRGPNLPFSPLWSFSLTVNIYNLIDVGLCMNFKFCFAYWLL